MKADAAQEPDLGHYYWLKVMAPMEQVETLVSLTFDQGALGVEEAMPDPDADAMGDAPPPPILGQTWFLAMFADALSRDAACDMLQSMEAHGFGPLSFEKGDAPIVDWDRSWREQQQPVHVTETLVVIPPWVPAPQAPCIIRLEAKRAFGTGQHESTALIASLMEKLPADSLGHVLDIGTGTGILALYAVFLGAKSVACFDIDPVAGPNLTENWNLNRHLWDGPSQHCLWLPFIAGIEAVRETARFDTVCCNMIRSEWWPFRHRLVDSLSSQGKLLVSGQRDSDRSLVEPWLREVGLQIKAEIQLNGWWAFQACR